MRKRGWKFWAAALAISLLLPGSTILVLAMLIVHVFMERRQRRLDGQYGLR